MSEKLLGEQMERMAGQAERATEKAAEARAELDQAMDLLTALGVAMTTKPGRGHPNPRTLTFTERIMALDRRNPSVMFVGGGGGVGEASGGMGGSSIPDPHVVPNDDLKTDSCDGDDPDATKPDLGGDVGFYGPRPDAAAEGHPVTLPSPDPLSKYRRQFPADMEPAPDSETDSDLALAGDPEPGAITSRSGLHVPDPVTPVPGQRLEVPDDASGGAAAASEPF